MPPLNVGDVLHKSAVIGLIGITASWAYFIPARLNVRDIFTLPPPPTVVPCHNLTRA